MIDPEAVSPPQLLSSLRTRPAVWVTGLILLIIVGLAGFAPLIAPQDPYDLASLDILDALAPPSWLPGGNPHFLLGTDSQGRDIFSAVLYGLRASLLIGILAVIIQAAIGVSLGAAAGFLGGTLDRVVTRLADIQLSLSTLMLAIIAMALFRASFGGSNLGAFAVPLLVVVIGLSEWPYFARTARAATAVEAAKDYVRAARALGASDAAILARHILPNITSPLIVVATTGIANAITAEAALSFLGLGMPPTRPSLGTLIRSGYDLIFAGNWWITILPGLALVILLLAINLLGDNLRDALDPRLQRD